MKSITTGLTLAVVLLGLHWWDTANGLPNCVKVGYNENLPGNPYDPLAGWYSNCYIHNGVWIASPMRCGLINPANPAAGYKQFDETSNSCVVPLPATTPATTEATTPSTTAATTPSTTEATTPSTTAATTPSTTEATTP